ncbi:MAG: nucleotidyl transferase AbiEii/AbiGii toxin family protein [Myxococcota bacterium]|jgi:hypothetical protein|nr:nucleotidyl transferase AbiEii/AbiGii toxin family protein [Myxococcota bacterium]
MDKRQPRQPENLPEHSEATLLALVERGLASCISLGGAFGLLHYLDYRQTHDVDAWWAEELSTQQQNLVIETIEASLRAFGQVTHRRWGDVVSIELAREGRKCFSFQIARRAGQLEPSTTAPWIDVPLDSLADLVASKMTALVERGAPRDFRDIHAICEAGLVAVERCWQLWQQRQRLAGVDVDRHRARLAILTHLARIEQHRPLAEIQDARARVVAQEIRQWFRTQVIGELGEP